MQYYFEETNMLSVTGAFVIIVLVLITYIAYRNHTHLSNIPIPPYNLFLGHLKDFKGSKVLQVLTNYTIKYGGLIRVYVPPVRPTVLITNPDIVQAILGSNKQLSKSKDYRFFKPWLGDGLLTSDVDLWKSRRRKLTPCFGRPMLLKQFIVVFESLGNILVEEFNKELGSYNTDVLPILKRYSLGAIFETAMGLSLNDHENNEYVRSIIEICRVVTNRLKVPYKRFDCIFRFTKNYRRQTEALHIIDSFFYDLIKTKKKYTGTTDEVNSDNESPCTFLDLLLKFTEEDHKFTINDVKDEVNTILLGGHDTTATGIAFALYMLSKHPDIQEKIIKEQLNIFGQLTNNSPSYEDLQNMKYLEMVIYEALRLFPPIPAIGRKILNDVHLENDVILPKNLNICILIYACHRNPKYFPEPEKFIPERFADSEIAPYTFLPFSAGPRNCIGKKFAVLQMKSCISKIIRNFKLEPSSSRYAIKLSPAVVLKSTNGIRLSLQKRTSS